MNDIESAVQLPARIDSWWEKESNSGVATTHREALERMKKGYDFFKTNGFPHIKLEDWKYTNVHKIVDLPYAWPAKNATALNKETFQSLPLSEIEDAYRLVFVNGYLNEELSVLPKDGKSFTVSHLGESADRDQYAENLATVVNTETGFTALNTALHTNGVLIDVPKNVVVDKPVLIFYVASTEDDLYLIQPRNLVIAEANSQVQFAEIFVSVGSQPSLTNVVTEIKVGEGAHLDYSRLQLEENQNFHVGFTGIEQQKDSRIDTHVISLDGAFVRNDLHFKLKGTNCSSILNGLYILKDQQFLDNHTRIDHAMPECFSDQLYKGILNDKATGVFNGKIIVHQDAQKTNAYQRNVNVLLSDDATINTKPQLEIFADDVRCTHGATAGSLDEEAIFYLRSRGLSEDSAQHLLLDAYANEILEKLNVEALKEPLRKWAAKKLK